MTMRTTNGAAMSDWATGTSHHEDRKSSGASSNAIRNPKPSITAEAPRGSSTKPSTTPAGRRAESDGCKSTDGEGDRRGDACERDGEHGRLPRLDQERRRRLEERAPAAPRSLDENREREEERERTGPEHADDGKALPSARPAEHVVLVGERGGAARPCLQDARPP